MGVGVEHAGLEKCVLGFFIKLFHRHRVPQKERLSREKPTIQYFLTDTAAERSYHHLLGTTLLKVILGSFHAHGYL